MPMTERQAKLVKLVKNGQQGLHFKSGRWMARGGFTEAELADVVNLWCETSGGRETGKLTPVGEVELTAYETKNGEIPIKTRGTR